MTLKVRIWADTHSTGLFDEVGRAFRRHETSISDATWLRLQEWVSDYDPIIPLSVAQRERSRAMIDALDARGLALMRQIAHEWPMAVEGGEPISFEYYSEGLMKRLDG